MASQMLDRSPIKGKQRLEMTLAVYWAVKREIRHTNKRPSGDLSPEMSRLALDVSVLISE